MSKITPTGINFYDNKNFNKKIFFKDVDLKFSLRNLFI